MRLDAVVAPAAAGLGLSAALLGPQSIGVVAFHVPGGGRRRLSPIGHGRCDGGSTYRHRARRPLHSFPSVDNCKSRCIGFGRVQTALSSRSSSDDFIDAIVEDKTAGLALDDEVNTSVRKNELLTPCRFIHLHCALVCSMNVSIVYNVTGEEAEAGHLQEGPARFGIPQPRRLQVALGPLQEERGGPDGGGVDGRHDGRGCVVRQAHGCR